MNEKTDEVAIQTLDGTKITIPRREDRESRNKRLERLIIALFCATSLDAIIGIIQTILCS